MAASIPARNPASHARWVGRAGEGGDDSVGCGVREVGVEPLHALNRATSEDDNR